MKTQFTDVQNLLAELEDFLSGNEDEHYIPGYKETPNEESKDMDREYEGTLYIEGSVGTEYHYIAAIGKIDDEYRARKICTILNGIPMLLSYIQQLEAKTGI